MSNACKASVLARAIGTVSSLDRTEHLEARVGAPRSQAQPAVLLTIGTTRRPSARATRLPQPLG